MSGENICGLTQNQLTGESLSQSILDRKYIPRFLGGGCLPMLFLSGFLKSSGGKRQFLSTVPSHVSIGFFALASSYQ